MRMAKVLGSMVAVGAAMFALSAASDARADDEFDVSGGAGSIEVKTKGGWHVNKNAPWKVTAGDKTFAKDKWTLGETNAKISGVPAGNATVKIYVCSGDKCKNMTKTVAVK